MDHSYRQLPSEGRKWNCTRIFLLLINIFNLATSLTAIIIGVMAHLFLFFSASHLLSFGFSYSQYSYYVYIYGTILLVVSCSGIVVAFRHSYRLTKFYTQLLSTVTVVETVCVILSMVLYPFMERHIWNIIQDTIDECDITSVAYYAIAYVQMSFECCGLNHPDSMTNDTKIQTSCYSKDKYTIYDSFCQPERFYKINCFKQVYNDSLEKLFIVLVYSVIMIGIQGLTIYFAALHGHHIQRARNNAVELVATDDVIINRYKRKDDFYE